MPNLLMHLRTSAARTTSFATSVLVVAGLLLVPGGGATATTPEHGDVRRAPTVGAYDLGVEQFPQPQEGRFAQMPVRLWGAIAAPAGDGPYPLVILAHGAHGDGCPVEDDADTWPCWDQERRSDLGFTYLVEHLAARGAVVVAPDVNAAYTGGWGESPSQEDRRFRQVMDATLDAVTRAGDGEAVFDGLDLTGRVDVSRIGVVGHSRGGYNAVRWSNQHDEVRSLFLLAPFFGPRPLPTIPVTVATGTCDGDTGTDGLRYVERALKKPTRPSPLVTLRVAGANHNYYNQTLVTAQLDDNTGSEPGCGPTARATAAEQQAWLSRVTAAHFRATLLQPRHVADFLKRSGPDRVRIQGLSTAVGRYFARP